MQTTTQRWISSLVIIAVAATAFGLGIKQAALFFWVIAFLALSSAIILLLRRQPQYWWVMLIAFILGGSFVFWLAISST